MSDSERVVKYYSGCDIESDHWYMVREMGDGSHQSVFWTEHEWGSGKKRTDDIQQALSIACKLLNGEDVSYMTEPPHEGDPEYAPSQMPGLYLTPPLPPDDFLDPLVAAATTHEKQINPQYNEEQQDA